MFYKCLFTVPLQVRLYVTVTKACFSWNRHITPVFQNLKVSSNEGWAELRKFSPPFTFYTGLIKVRNTDVLVIQIFVIQIPLYLDPICISKSIKKTVLNVSFFFHFFAVSGPGFKSNRRIFYLPNSGLHRVAHSSWLDFVSCSLLPGTRIFPLSNP